MADHNHAELATRADLAALRSEMRWVLGLIFPIVLANSAKLFGIL